VGRFASLARDGFGEEVGGIKRSGTEGGGGVRVCDTPNFCCSLHLVIYSVSSCNRWKSRGSDLVSS
jgi:hypothetical protein